MNFFNAYEEAEKRNIVLLFRELNHVLNSDIGENNFFTIPLIEKLLKEKNIPFTKKELHDAIYIFLIHVGNVIRYDYWNSEPIFQVLDKRHEYTNYQKAFKSLEDDPLETKRFILIADTHIGNEINNFTIINNIYDLALQKGIKNIFHLGDIFEGIKCNDSEEIKQLKIENQLKLFNTYYPNIDEIRTISLLGNHDKSIYGTQGTDVTIDYFNEKSKPQIYDLRKITFDNPNFLLYVKKMFTLYFNEIPVHLSHRFYANGLYEYIILNDFKKLDDIMKLIACDYPIYFSAHLHKSFIYENNDCYGRKIVYLGVPSTSSLNIGDCVANLIEITPERDISITMICSDNNCNLYLGSEYDYKVQENGKVLRKEIKKCV